MRHLFSLICLISMIALCSCASYMGEQEYKTVEKVFYTKNKMIRQSGTLLIPHQPRLDKDKKTPIIYVVHGGGWYSRSHEDTMSIAESFASHGYIVFNINYRLAPEHKHPTQANDLALAVNFLPNYLKDNYKIDAGSYGLWGYSSGAHTVSYFSLKTAKDQNMVLPKVIAAGGAPFDLTWYQKSPIIIKLIGTYRDESLEKYFEASPTEWLKGEIPAFYIYHAKKDNLVEYAQAASFEAKLKRLNIPTKFYAIDWWGHSGAFLYSDKAIEVGIKYFDQFF